MPSTMNDVIEGISTSVAVKAPVALATTGNITLSGEQTIDGTLTSETRVLVKDQTTAAQNGIYKSRTSAWTREPDFDGNRDVSEGTIIPVNRGTTNADTMWRVTTTGAITIDTTSLTFERAAVNDSNTVSFLQAGTGAVTRTVQADLRELIKVTQFGTPTGTNDNAMVAAAFVAGAGKRIHFPAGTYAVNDLTWPANTLFTGDGVGTIIKKRANGDIGTLGAMSAVHDIYFDLNGTNYTGRGFVVSTGAVDFTSWREWYRCQFIDSYSYAIEFTAALAGYQSYADSCRFTMSSAGATPYATPAIKLPSANETNGNRHFHNCNSGGYILMDFGGSENTNLTNCLMAPPLFSSTTQKAVIVGGRMVTRSDSSAWTIDGSETCIVGNSCAQLLVTFASTLDSSTIDATNWDAATFTDNAPGNAQNNSIFLPSIIYTPAWTATGTAPDIGNGQLFGSYVRRGEDCRVRITWLAGSTSTFGTGNWKFSLPYDAADVSTGTVTAFDGGGGGTAYHLHGLTSENLDTLLLTVHAAGYVTPTSPFTWANGDAMYIDIDYRIA